MIESFKNYLFQTCTSEEAVLSAQMNNGHLMTAHNEGIKRMIDRQQEEAKKAEARKHEEVMSLFAQRARVHLKIVGKVQGVFFRSFVQKAAEDLRLAGWVRNCEDASVEVIAEGEKPALEKLIEQCKKGPAWASIEKVDVKWDKFVGEFGAFAVKD